MSDILVVIVTYNPNIEFLKGSIFSFSEVDILVVDNYSSNVDEIISLCKSSNTKLIRNSENLGIANALQQGLDYACQNGFNYLLTMDQDSQFRNGYSRLLGGFSKTGDVAIVCPSIVDVNSNNHNISQKEYEDIFVTITSGSLCDVNLLKSIGGFNTKLFIDYVDFEICLKLKKVGYRILRTNHVILSHSLGDSKMIEFLGFKFIVTNHSPIRRYYSSRNRIFLLKKYFFNFPKFFMHDILSFFKTLLIILLFERNRREKFYYIGKGVCKGLLMN